MNILFTEGGEDVKEEPAENDSDPDAGVYIFHFLGEYEFNVDHS